jgi:hypothetical protein
MVLPSLCLNASAMILVGDFSYSVPYSPHAA